MRTVASLQFRIYPGFLDMVCISGTPLFLCAIALVGVLPPICLSLFPILVPLCHRTAVPSAFTFTTRCRAAISRHSKLSNTSSSVQRFTYLLRFTQSTQSVCERTTHSFTIHIDPLCRITVRTRQSAPPNGLVANDANSPARTAQSQAQPQALLQDCHGPTLCPHCTQPRFWLAWTRLPW